MGSTQLNLSSLPSPETIARRVFANGAVGLAWENFCSPSVVVHGWIWVGGIDVPAEQAGLANLVASMLTRGTERRTFAQINEQIESVGASFTVGAGGHTTSFVAKCLAEDLPLILDILTDCLYHPGFPSEYIEKRRGEILTALQQREHNTRMMASLRFNELMYPNHPYGRSQLGYKETVQDLTREDVVRFYRENFGPRDGATARPMGAIIVGAIPSQKALDVLEEALGHWQGTSHSQPSLPPVDPIDTIREKHTEVHGKTQSDIILGWLGLERRNPDFLKVYLADCVLGQFGLMGRIGEYVREEQGLAYRAHTILQAGLGPGPWATIAGVAPENVERAVDAILEQIRRIRQELVDEQELADNKAYILGSMPLRLESKEAIAAQIASMEIHQLGLDYLQRYPNQIQALTSQDVMDVTQKYLHPDAYALSVAGPG